MCLYCCRDALWEEASTAEKRGRTELEDIIEIYGESLLQIVGGICALALFAALSADGGMLFYIVQQYLAGICG